jgi:hypothetical protein
MAQSLSQYKRKVFNKLVNLTKSPVASNLLLSMQEGVAEVEFGFYNNRSSLEVAAQIYAQRHKAVHTAKA